MPLPDRAELHLQQRVGVLQEPSSNGVTCLVIRHRLLLLRLQDLSLLLQTSNTNRKCSVSALNTQTWFSQLGGNSPPMTLSIACSKCFWLMASERWRAAIRAASLQTLAMSAPDIKQGEEAQRVNKVPAVMERMSDSKST